MRFAYADPPYPGMAHLYKDHPDYAGEVDHKALIARLVAEFPDGWALSTSSKTLKYVLTFCPDSVRLLSWVKPGATGFQGHHLWDMWEPVVLNGGRNMYTIRRHSDMHVRNFHSESASAMNWDASFIGKKPIGFSFWLFRCLGALPGDDLVDLFPGSGAVGRAWDKFQRQMTLPTLGEREKQARIEVTP